MFDIIGRMRRAEAWRAQEPFEGEPVVPYYFTVVSALGGEGKAEERAAVFHTYACLYAAPGRPRVYVSNVGRWSGLSIAKCEVSQFITGFTPSRQQAKDHRAFFQLKRSQEAAYWDLSCAGAEALGLPVAMMVFGALPLNRAVVYQYSVPSARLEKIAEAFKAARITFD